MSHKSYSKIRQTLDSFQKEYYKNQNKTDVEDEDSQIPSKTVSCNLTLSSTIMPVKPILRPRSTRRKAKKSQINEPPPTVPRKSTRFKKPLREIHYVESYKEYNIDVSEENTSWFCGFSCFFQKKRLLK